jgi:ATP-dependent RNA helicase DeaD
METYRLEVGNNDKITPSNIVGAIANEADIESRFIGEIKLYDEYSTVDLPAGMPKELLNYLKKVRICAKPMRLSLLNGKGLTSPKTESEPRAPRKRPVTDRSRKTLSRNNKDTPSTDGKHRAKPSAKGAKRPTKNDLAKSVDGRRSKTGKPMDGSAPLTKKKKSYTKKPKRS